MVADKQNLAPVVLFVYNRPAHTRATLEALKKNTLATRSQLYVFADGPKENATEEELKNINLTREIILQEPWCGEVSLFTREKNVTLSDNIINGITDIIQKHGKVIVLEDDLVTSPYFLQYCNDGLDTYEASKQVFSINGFMFPIDFESVPGAFLSPIATSSWGWATWADRWLQFEAKPKYINEIESNISLKNRFNLGNLDYLYMLKNINTWDIRWYYSAFTRNGLGLFPTHSLVQNIGFDGSGSHGGNERLEQGLYAAPLPVINQSSIDLKKYSKLVNYFTNDASQVSPGQKIKNMLKKLIRRSTFSR
jgi:hypothetical protein